MRAGLSLMYQWGSGLLGEGPGLNLTLTGGAEPDVNGTLGWFSYYCDVRLPVPSVASTVSAYGIRLPFVTG